MYEIRKSVIFMVEDGIILVDKISKNGIEVDLRKVTMIKKLPPPILVTGMLVFLGQAAL